MKNLSLVLALILSLNSFSGVASAEGTKLSEEREEELLKIARKNPKKALANLTDAELIQVSKDLRILIKNLETSFSAEPMVDHDGRKGYTIRDWSDVSVPLMVLLTLGGIVMRSKAYKSSPDNPIAYVVILVLGAGLTKTLAETSKTVVWLTAEEEVLVQNRIKRLHELSAAMDGRFHE